MTNSHFCSYLKYDARTSFIRTFQFELFLEPSKSRLPFKVAKGYRVNSSFGKMFFRGQLYFVRLYSVLVVMKSPSWALKADETLIKVGGGGHRVSVRASQPVSPGLILGSNVAELMDRALL